MHRLILLAASPYSISCTDVGNCPTKTTSIDVGFTNVTHGLLFAIGLLAVIFIIISGLQMALSAGNPKRFAQGQQSLLYSVIGVVLAIVAYGLVSFVAGAF